jgi:DNA-directed RNA polymerase specialized sigma24 family protein
MLVEAFENAPGLGLTDRIVSEVLDCEPSTWQQWIHRGRLRLEDLHGVKEMERLVPTWAAPRRGKPR